MSIDTIEENGYRLSRSEDTSLIKVGAINLPYKGGYHQKKQPRFIGGAD